MTPHEALAEALAFIAGQRGTALQDVEEDAATILGRLAERGLAIVPMPDVARGRYSPAELRSKRKALGLTVRMLAQEAGVVEDTVRRAEQPGSRSQSTKIAVIAAVLDRLTVEQKG